MRRRGPRGQAVRMDDRRTVKVSKYLSKHLRHQPERIGLTLDANGWVAIDELLGAVARHHFPLTRAELDDVVASNDKQRFAIEGDRIRASQGHTVEVDLNLPPAEPPAVPLPRHRRPVPGRDPRRGAESDESHARPSLARPRDGDPRRSPTRPACRPVRGRGCHAPGRTRLLCQRQRGLAHRRRTPAVPAPARLTERPRPQTGRLADRTTGRLDDWTTGRPRPFGRCPGTAHRPASWSSPCVTFRSKSFSSATAARNSGLPSGTGAWITISVKPSPRTCPRSARTRPRKRTVRPGPDEIRVVVRCEAMRPSTTAEPRSSHGRRSAIGRGRR